MHLHISRVRRNGKSYAYAQLVQSFRRPDGMPSQKVVANLGRLDDLQIQNLRAALQASRNNERVVLREQLLPAAARFIKPTQNLRYLDVAVLLQLWQQWGLDELLEQVLDGGDATVKPADVVAALVLQRCVDPGSKLYAERWFPRTALPELLGIAPSSFNNTRLHRVLEQLDRAQEPLMRRLPELYRKRQGEFVSLFLDITDTSFVGNGPVLAEKAKTKQGTVERKIGIVLLCNERGYPLRWHVLAGKQAEPPAMHSVFEEIRGLSWVGNAPVVCDRAMGASAELLKLLRTQVQFVTALRVNEYAAYTNDIPYGCVAELEPAAKPPDKGADPCIQEAAACVQQAGMQYVSPTLNVLDLGVVERDAVLQGPVLSDAQTDIVVTALRMARKLRTMVQEGDVETYASAARRLGMTVAKGKWYRTLLKLDEGIQQDILHGKASTLSITKLEKLARLRDSAAQRQQFEQLLACSTKQAVSTPAAEQAPTEPPCPLRVRAVVCFNPRLFAEKRRLAQQQLDSVRAYVCELNRKLTRPRCRRQRRHIEAELDRMLRRRSLLDVYRVEVRKQRFADDTMRYQAQVELDLDKWQRRRRYDGFNVVVAHPEVARSAVELAELYREKDAVERDFRVIKSLVKLRPVWHRTDEKVRAHVTLCMLALLLERTLNDKLARHTPERAIETLRTCCLNRFESGASQSHYVVTQPDDEQMALLRQLGLEAVVDDDEIAATLRPR